LLALSLDTHARVCYELQVWSLLPGGQFNFGFAATYAVAPGLDDRFRDMISKSIARGFIAGEDVLSIGFFPRESHLYTFRDPTPF